MNKPRNPKSAIKLGHWIIKPVWLIDLWEFVRLIIFQRVLCLDNSIDGILLCNRYTNVSGIFPLSLWVSFKGKGNYLISTKLNGYVNIFH